MSVDAFIESRQADWRALERLVASRRLPETAVGELGRLYLRTVSDLAYARDRHPELVPYLNRLVSRAHNTVYGAPRGSLRGVWAFYRWQFPHLLGRVLPIVAAAVAIFAASIALAFAASTLAPQTTNAFLPGPLRNVEQNLPPMGERRIGEALEPLASSAIVTNNVQVSFLAFAGGMLLGVGTVYVLATNGFMLGGLAAIYHRHGLGLEFWATILPHGVLELSAIALSGAAGLMLGRALLAPGDFSRRDALVRNGRQALKLIAGVAAMLLVAGTIEGFFSFHGYPPAVELTVAAASGALFLAYVALGLRIAARELRGGAPDPSR